MQEVERMSCARDCADCGFLFRGGGRWGKVILYAVMVGGGKVQEEALCYSAEGVHLFGVVVVAESKAWIIE